MSEIYEAQPLSTPNSAELRFLPEGPFPIAESVLSWVGIQHGLESKTGSVNRLDLRSGSNESFELPGRPGFAFPCQTPGRFVVGCERSLGFFDTETSRWEPFCEGVDASVENTIINDGLFLDDNLIFGTKDLEFATKKAGLYLYRGRDGKLIQLRDDQICSNGKAILTSDGQTQLIDIDSPTRTIVSYPLDVDGGTIGSPSVLVDLTSDPAVPDGAILTPDGSGIIVSMFLPSVAEYGETRLYDLKTGEKKVVWKTPGSPQNTCPALVLHEGSLKLIITTAVENMSADDQQQCPNAGQLFYSESHLDPGPFRMTVFPK